MNSKYWKTSLDELLCDMKLTLTDEQKNELIEGIMGIAENESLYCGYDCIPNPRDEEIERLKKDIEKMQDSHEKTLWGIRKGVGERRNVDPNDVHIDSDGYVTYDRR